MAAAQGVSGARVRRIRRRHDLRPHLDGTLKLSGDKRLVEKLCAEVGLYLKRPREFLVLCADENSEIRPLDRARPGGPMERGRRGAMTHECKGDGTGTLFAILDIL